MKANLSIYSFMENASASYYTQSLFLISKNTFECCFFSNQSDSLQLLIGVFRPIITFSGIIDLVGFIYFGYVGPHC